MEDTDEPAHTSEGLPSCLSSVLIFFILPDYPETTHWLTEDKKKLAAYRLKDQGSKGSSKPMTWGEAKETLTDWWLYAHYAVCPNFFIYPNLAMFIANSDLLWSISPIFELVIVHAVDRCWIGLQIAQGQSHDSAAVRSGLCCHCCYLLVGRSV
jgi:hypothetical protein